MEQYNLEAKERVTIGKQSRSLRGKGLIPAIVYGKDMGSLPIEVDQKLFHKFLTSAHSKNIIINLKVGSNSMPVLMHEVQKDVLSRQVLHVDFYRIRMDKAIRTKVPITIIGEATGVKEEGGILVHPLREIEIKALPADIPGKIEVDISALKVGDAIHVSSLKPIKGVEYLTAAQDIIVTVSSPTKEEEVAPVVAAPEAVAGAPAAEAGAAPAAGAPPAVPAAAPVAAGKKEAAPAVKAEKPKAEKPKK